MKSKKIIEIKFIKYSFLVGCVSFLFGFLLLTTLDLEFKNS
jgi:hypothetical protein